MPQILRNPATLEPIGEVPDSGADDIGRAVADARAAQSAWREAPGAERAALLRATGARIRARAHELATLLTREAGRPLCESLDCVGAAATLFDACAAIAASGSGSAGESGQRSYLLRAPDGIVAALVPFNYPLVQMAGMVAPMVAAGNALLCKLPHQDPLACLMLAGLCDALPAGLVNVVTGGPDTGRALVEHPGIDRVTFSGSAAAGRSIAASAQGKRIDLSPGSVDSVIVVAMRILISRCRALRGPDCGTPARRAARASTSTSSARSPPNSWSACTSASDSSMSTIRQIHEPTSAR